MRLCCAMHEDSAGVMEETLLHEHDAMPWSWTIELAWKSTLRFHEHRLALLRDIEDADLLHAYRVQDDEVGALIGPRHHELIVTRMGFGLIIRGTESRQEVDQSLDVMAMVLARITPDIHQMRFLFQHIVAAPAGRSYDDVRHEAARTLMPTAEAVGATDFAVLLDGVLRYPYQVEFGPINADELRDRAYRRVGRIHPGTHFSAAPPEDGMVFPPVAYYADTKWLDWPLPEGGLTASEMLNSWRSAADLTGELVDTLIGAMSTPASEGER